MNTFVAHISLSPYTTGMNVYLDLEDKRLVR